MPVLVPTQPTVHWAWGMAWHEADHLCPFTVVLKLSVCACVELNLHSHACLHGTHRNNLQKPDCTENIVNYIPVWRVAFTHLLLSSVSICFAWTQMSVLFLPWIGGLVAASFCGFVWTPVAFKCHTVWSKRVENATFFLLSSHPSFYRNWNLSLLWLLGILSQRREKVCAIFIYLFFWGSLHCFWCTWTCYECSKCLYRTDTKFELLYLLFV